MKFTDTIKKYIRKDIIYANKDERLADVIFKMSKNKNDIVVVKSKNDIIGLITETDIFHTLVNKVFPEKKISKNLDDIEVVDILRGPPAQVVMSKCQQEGPQPCIYIYEDESIEDAIRILQTGGLHHLLVFDKKNKLIGTLSSHEIIKSLTNIKS